MALEITRVLGVYAHPDDADVGAGGTLSRFAREGAEVTVLVITSGGEGGFDDTPRDEVTGIRQAEQRAAAAALGVDDVRFLEGYADGDLWVTRDLVHDITRVIRQTRPQLILTTTPERNWESVGASHSDHLAAGEAVLRAVYPAARNPFAFPDLLETGLEPWVVDEVWLQGHPERNHHVALDAEDVDRKIAAVSAHGSQFADLAAIAAFVRDRATEEATGTDAAHAERFFRVNVRGHD